VATDELDELLMDRFNLARADLVAALKTLPAQRPGAAALSEEEAHLLDSAGFTEEPHAYAPMAAAAIAHMGHLYGKSYDGYPDDDVAATQLRCCSFLTNAAPNAFAE
jgi:hypothetical protein